MKIKYISKRFSQTSKEIIDVANQIIEDYLSQGFMLTLRQLYYQFVSRDLIPNKQTEYKRLGSILNDARLAGLIDWNSIEDRTRNLIALPNWSEPSEIIRSAAQQYRVDYWKGQEYRPEVWIEKDALTGVIAGVCREYDTPYFSCRGYTSQSEVWAASQRFSGYIEDRQIPIIIHLGDHDPSGIDMTRDIQDRMNVFGVDVETIRIALNMDQVKKYSPPPNPAKITDSRFQGYVSNFGEESWELDALEPKVISALVKKELKKLIDPEKWKLSEEDQQEGRDKILEMAEQI